MLEVRADRADEAGPLTLERVMRPGGGSDVVRFVDYKEIELARMAGMGRQDVPHGPQPLATLDPVHRGDEARMRCPRVGVDAAFAPQLLDVGCVHHAEVEAELLQHLDTPLFLERSGADDQDGAGAVPEQHLLDDQHCLDGLSQADVVGDEEVDTSHVDCAYQRVELKVLNADAAPERRLQKSSVSICGGAPSHCIQEGFERV